ncbi:hypothetical protein [Actinomycetospora soli]|uniref:hypothetical protein n=1 Tax=Actinomycetospora soli TaxID=2893887 RepID=UPI001E46403B|nr:hypothetical protein [Actinomycetospora soli]MCD2188012.1 hypothetical protein [Actinomycetospora soli]
MTGAPGTGGESFTNYSTGAAGTPGSSAHDAGRSPSRPRGGVGSTAVLVVAVILLLAFLAAVLLL